MNINTEITPPVKAVLLALSVSVMTSIFIYLQMLGYSILIHILIFGLILLALLSKRFFSAIHPHIIKIILFCILIYVSISYGLFFSYSKSSQLIGFFAAILLPIIFIYPRFMTYFTLTLILFFSSSSYGILDTRGMVNFLGGVFNRGDVKYGISYANILLIFTAVSIMFRAIISTTDDNRYPFCNLYKYFLLFNGVFLIYTFWGIVSGIDMKSILAGTGVFHLTNMTIFVFIMLRIFRTEKDFEKLKLFFLSCMMTRGIWSFFRFIFGKGDPRNVYANMLGITDVKVSLFDIGDGLIQCVGLFYALYMLFNKENRTLSRRETMLYWMIACVGLFNIAFSYRRTGWFGLLIAFIWLMMNLRLKQRIVTSLLALTIGMVLFTGIAASRFESVEHRPRGMFADIMTEEGSIDIKRGRFLELYTAWQTIKDNFLFGVGPWGKYKLFVSEKKWGFIPELTHSSVVHIMLKMGILGLLIYILIYLSYVHFWLSKRKEVPDAVRGFAEASFAGFIFFIPDILWGTPIVEYRHMLLLGFVMSVPYITYHIYKAGNPEVRRSVFCN